MSSWQYDNGLALNRRQPIIWTSDIGQVYYDTHMRHSVSVI